MAFVREYWWVILVVIVAALVWFTRRPRSN